MTTPTTNFAGTATDNVGVAAVTILIKDRDTGLWRRPDGTWRASTTGAQHMATVVGSTSATWTLDDVAAGTGQLPGDRPGA